MHKHTNLEKAECHFKFKPVKINAYDFELIAGLEHGRSAGPSTIFLTNDSKQTAPWEMVWVFRTYLSSLCNTLCIFLASSGLFRAFQKYLERNNYAVMKCNTGSISWRADPNDHGKSCGKREAGSCNSWPGRISFSLPGLRNGAAIFSIQFLKIEKVVLSSSVFGSRSVFPYLSLFYTPPPVNPSAHPSYLLSISLGQFNWSRLLMG